MSALDEIRKKKNHELDAIERLIIEAWECLDGREWMSDDAAEELEALRKENELLRSGAQLGPIVGAEVIRKQEVELAALRRVAEAASAVIDGEQMFGYPSPADMKKLEEALSCVK